MFLISYLCNIKLCIFAHSENALNPWFSGMTVSGMEADASALGRVATAAADTNKKMRAFFESNDINK